MHVERIDLNAVLLKLRFQWSFGSDINGAERLQNLHQSLCYFRVDAFDAGVVVGIEGREAHDEIGFGGIDAVGFDNLRIGCKMIRMQKIKDHFQKFHLRGDLRGYRSICPIRVRTISR